ncbi:MAG TPA: ABC transporter substrate-binding protein, partial [Gemmatimonadaceae bacterium]|nr:ABC transporter substrate-binding protein [Gemmatimonadaceae bacterium]
MRQQNTSRISRRRRTLVVVTTLALAGSMGLSWNRSTTAAADREVPIGGLFSLTGNWAGLGLAGRAAMELAVDDVNRYLTGNAANVRFVAMIEDTKLDPELAVEKARVLRARGVQLLIGAQSSAEVVRLKPFVDSAGMLLVSPSSTAGSLAIAGDNVFRFCPSDSLEGIAIAAMMWDDGVRVVVPIWRDDAGMAGLKNATNAAFGVRGGTALKGAGYATNVTDFGSVVADADAQVQ